MNIVLFYIQDGNYSGIGKYIVETVMVNNSTNINRTHNLLSPQLVEHTKPWHMTL